MPTGFYTRTEEYRRIMSEAKKKSPTRYWLGKKRIFSEDHKKNMSIGQTGLKKSEETRKKMSESQLGEKGSRWKGGLTKINGEIRASQKYKDLKKKVFERDSSKCVLCGSTDKIVIDHIKPFSLFPKLRFVIDNVRTLCYDCHRNTDTFSGRVYRYKEKI